MGNSYTKLKQEYYPTENAKTYRDKLLLNIINELRHNMEGHIHPNIFINYVSDADAYAYKYSKTGKSLIIYEFFENKSAIRLAYYICTDDINIEPHLRNYKFNYYIWRCCGSQSKDHKNICKKLL